MSENPELHGNGPFGAPMDRLEDPELISGRGKFVDDLHRPGMLHASILRSQYSHATINEIDTSRAEQAENVVTTITHNDLDAANIPGDAPQIYRVPGLVETENPLLARDKVRYQGKPVAIVVAEDRYTAHNATGLIDIEYDRLEPVTDPIEALAEDAPTIRDEFDDNVAFTWEAGDKDEVDKAFAEADQTVDFDYHNQRVVPNAIEPRGALAEYDALTDELTVHLPSQQPFVYKAIMADVLDHPERKVRIRAPNIGGGFGSKSNFYVDEALTAFCAMQLERPVKWIETRSEAFTADHHGRGQYIEAEAAIKDDTITALRVNTTAGIGGDLGPKGCLAPSTTFGLLLSGQYDIPAIRFESQAVYTNASPTGVYRGVGRAEAICTVERIMDLVAQELDADPAEFRRQHFIDPTAFPYETAVGSVYDSGEYERAFNKALEIVNYDALRDRQAELRKEDRYIGIGISCFLESGGLAPSNVSNLLGMAQPDATVKSSFWESSTVRIHGSGEVTVYVGTSSPGTGIETTHTQIVADRLGVDVDDISLYEGKDTQQAPDGTGSIGSRSGPVGGGAITWSIDKVIQKAKRVAAHQFEASEDDVVFEDGEFFIAGAPDQAMPLQQVAEETQLAVDLPPGEEPGLEATSYYDPENFTWAFGTHIAVVEVDPDTGEVEFLDYVAVDDCGNQINPKIVAGQIQGSVAQGIGQARYEGAVYDDNGNLITGSLQDYTVPKAIHLIDLQLDNTVTPSPHNPLGVKGVAESGTIAATPAVGNAVADALGPFGVEHVEMPITDEKVWRAINSGREN